MQLTRLAAPGERGRLHDDRRDRRDRVDHAAGHRRRGGDQRGHSPGQARSNSKQAYAAAQAGIADYEFHLNNDVGYWTRCTTLPGPNAVNQAGPRSADDPARARRDGWVHLCDRAATGDRQVVVLDERSGGHDARIERTQHRNLPDPRHRILRPLRRPPSSPPSNRPPSSTTSTSPSSRPPTQSPTASRIRRLLSMVPTRSAPSSGGTAGRLADPGNQQSVLRSDRLRRGGQHQRAPAHQ